MMLAPGLRVVRGPDWSWKDQDGGEGYVGTVCELGRPGSGVSPDKTVVIQWDSGARTNYRIGYQGKYDLRVVDNAQVGVKHQNIVCDGCKRHGITGMRFRCTRCTDYDLCSLCYHGDKHDLSHQFQRFDSATAQGVELPPRTSALRCILRGIFVGSRVVRGIDWEWGEQDGGAGCTGRVTDIRDWDPDSARSVANVTWSSGTTNVYRLGHRGNCDLKFVQESSGGYYYRDHVPVLGQHVEQTTPVRSLPTRNNQVQFSVGDKVRINVDVDTLKALQQGHGGWNQRMAEYIGKMGTVHRVTVKGDIRVQHEGCNNRWTYNPAALVKVIYFSVGDIICVESDMTKVKDLQKGHGEWIDIMKNALGKLGKIIKVYADGDLRIQIDGTAWTLNPACVRLLPGSATELSNTMHADQNQRAEPSLSWALGNGEQNPGSSLASVLVREAAQGNLDVIKRTLESLQTTLPSETKPADVTSFGRTALQVAAHQGHLHIVRYLLSVGASVNIMDMDGDTTLHYAAFGNQPEIVEMLLEHGADINSLNKGRCTALHIAVHKQPPQCVRLLLNRGADVNIQDSYGDTALHDAIGKKNDGVITALCSTPGMDFTLRNKRGFNVLHHASLKGNNFATRTLVSKARQLVDVKKDDGFSALHLASLNGHKDVVNTLVRLGQADIELRNNRNQTALLLAVSQGRCSVIELLVNLKANVNVQDDEGDTALHLVVMKCANLNTEPQQIDSPAIHNVYQRLNPFTEHRIATAIACYLVAVGCDVDKANMKGQTVLDLIQDSVKKDLLLSFKNVVIPVAPAVPVEDSNRDLETVFNDLMDTVLISEERASNHRRNPSEGFNLTPETTNSPVHTPQTPKKQNPQNHGRHVYNNQPNHQHSPSRDAVVPDPISPPRSRSGNRAQEGTSTPSRSPVAPTSPPLSPPHTLKPAECAICSELSEDNVCLEPCGHRPACEDCVARLKKCLLCGEPVQKRVTRDGRVVPPQARQPYTERMRYLECKVAEIEETHGCSICMERRKNVVFLCGHGTCSKCADTLKICHMCRKTITKKIPLY